MTVSSTSLASRLILAKVLLGVFSSNRKTFSWNLFVILGKILFCQNRFQKTFLSKCSLNFIHSTKNWLQEKCFNLWSTTACHTETRPTLRREICSILWSHTRETNRFVNIDAYFSPIAPWIFAAIKIHFVFTRSRSCFFGKPILSSYYQGVNKWHNFEKCNVEMLMKDLLVIFSYQIYSDFSCWLFYKIKL